MATNIPCATGDGSYWETRTFPGKTPPMFLSGTPSLARLGRSPSALERSGAEQLLTIMRTVWPDLGKEPGVDPKSPHAVTEMIEGAVRGVIKAREEARIRWGADSSTPIRLSVVQGDLQAIQRSAHGRESRDRVGRSPQPDTSFWAIQPWGGR